MHLWCPRHFDAGPDHAPTETVLAVTSYREYATCDRKMLDYGTSAITLFPTSVRLQNEPSESIAVVWVKKKFIAPALWEV